MKKLLCLICLLFMEFCLFSQEKLVFKIVTLAPPRSPWEIELKKLAQEWNRITNGQVTLKFYDMVVLGGEKSGLQKMKSPRPGQKAPIDGGVFSMVGLNEAAPNAKIFTLSAPFLIQTQEQLDAALEKYGAEFEKEIEKSGYKLLTWSNVGWLSFYTKDKFSSLQDVKKLKLLCSNDTKDFSDVLKLCGFNVETVAPAKFNQQIRSSSARGFATVHLLTYATGLYKEVNYALETRLCPAMAGFLMTKEAWDSIPAKYKDELIAALEKTRKNLNDALEDMDKACVQKMTKAGLTMITLTPEEKAAWAAEFGKDTENVAKKLPNVLDMDIYRKINKLLETYHK